MAKNFVVAFGSGSPATNTGLSPTFTVFKTTPGGVNTAPPGITEVPTATGLYYFTYGPTNTISFVIDGGAALLTSIRYIPGILDPIDAVDEQLTAQGNTLLAAITAVGASFGGLAGLIGSTASSFGTSSVDPGDLFGYVKRLQEFNEGDSTFTKGTGTWDVYSRGASVLLADKQLTDTTGTVSKS